MFRMFFVKFPSPAHLFVIQSGYQFVHDILQRLVRPENKNHSVKKQSSWIENLEIFGNQSGDLLDVRLGFVENMFARRTVSFPVEMLEDTAPAN